MGLENLLFGNSRGDFKVDKRLQGLFVSALNEAGFDEFGFCKTWRSDTPAPTPYNEQATATHHFVIQPYVWDNLEQAAMVPNFLDRTTGLKLRWYEYPLRDAYANYDLTEEMLIPILERLIEECREHGATPYRGEGSS